MEVPYNPVGADWNVTSKTSPILISDAEVRKLIEMHSEHYFIIEVT